MRTDHLPFPMPARRHALVQSWLDLTFLHWPVAPERLAPYLPEGLELDTHEGVAYLGVIPFNMTGVRPRWAPKVPGVSTFPEFNLRTYVKHGGKAGVLFLTLEAQSRITCAYAPRAYGLPYRYSRGFVRANEEGHHWSTQRKGGTHAFAGTCRPSGPEREAEAGTLEHFLFERYSLYTEHKGRLMIAHTQHDPWVWREGEATVEANALTEAFDLGIEAVHTPALVHLSKGVKVHTWSNEVVR